MDLILEPELLVLHDEPDRVGTRTVEGIDGIDLTDELAEPLQVGTEVLRPEWSIDLIDDLTASLLERATERSDVLVPRSVVCCRDGHSSVSECAICVRCHGGILLTVGDTDTKDIRASHRRITCQGLQASIRDNRGQLVLCEVVSQRSSLVTQGNASQQVYAVALDELPSLRKRLLGLASRVFDDGFNRSPGHLHPRLLESKLQPAEVPLAVGSRWARQVEKNTQPDRLGGDRRRCGGWGSCGGRRSSRRCRRGSHSARWRGGGGRFTAARHECRNSQNAHGQTEKLASSHQSPPLPARSCLALVHPVEYTHSRLLATKGYCSANSEHRPGATVTHRSVRK
jgi:hypothetical protein